MLVKLKCCIAILLVLASSTKGQVLNGPITANYIRSGFSLVFLSDPTSSYRAELEQAFSRMGVPPKYDFNQLKTPVLERPADLSVNNSNYLLGFLAQKQVPQQLAGYIFNEKDGLYNYDRLFERAKYTFDDNTVMRLKQSAQGVDGIAKTDAWILPLIANTYVAVLDVRSVFNWDAHYDKIDADRREGAKKNKTVFLPVKREHHGYQMDIAGAIYKLNLTDSLLNQFFQDYWVDGNSKPEMKKVALAKRERMRLPLQKVLVVDNFRNNFSFKTDFEELPSPAHGLALAKDQLLEMAQSQLNDLKVKQVIYDVWPIRAKIGTKEGIHPDSKFSIYENVQMPDGTTQAQWKGIVRASVNVTDNATIATGETVPTRFYQVAGKKLDIGMTMVEEPGAIGSVAAGFYNNGFGGAYLRFEALTKGFGSKHWFWDNSRVYLEGTISGAGFGSTFGQLNVKDNNSTSGPVSRITKESTAVTLFGIALGASKYFNFFRNVQAGPYLGLRGDFAQFNNNNLHEAVKSDYGDLYGLKGITIDLGVRAGIVLRRNFRLVGSYGIAPHFTNSPFFGVNKPLKLTSTANTRVSLEPGTQTDQFNENGSQNPFYLRYDWVRWDLGIHFEF